MANGLAEMTGESLVLKYPDQFSEGAIAAAKARIAALAAKAAETA
jgi:hypothetical protein